MCMRHVSSSTFCMSLTVRYHINIVSTVALSVKYLITIIKNVSLCDITGIHCTCTLKVSHC